MSEEITEKPAPNTVTPPKEEPELSPDEVLASKEGWKPKDKWEGAEDEWVSAKAFLKFGQVQSQLKHAKQEASQKEKVINAMKQFHLQVKEDAKKEVIDTLKKSKREAVKAEDFQKVAELDLQLDELETNLDIRFKNMDVKQREMEQANAGPTAEFTDWNQKNGWYKMGSTTGLTKEADILGMAYLQANPDARNRPMEILEYVEKRIRKLYPEEFENKERERPSPVDDGPRERPESPKTSSRVKLTEAEKSAAEAFGMTHAEYAAGLKKWDDMKGRG